MGAARAEIEDLAVEMAVVADRWRKAEAQWGRALRNGDRELARAERRLVKATGGLGLRRWEMATRRRRILTVADAKLRAGALRDRPAVEAAIAERDRVAAEAADRIAGAARLLAECSAELLPYGPLGAGLAGTTPEDLTSLAAKRAGSR